MTKRIEQNNQNLTMFLVIGEEVVNKGRSVDKTLEGRVEITCIGRVHQATSHTSLLSPFQFDSVFVV